MFRFARPLVSTLALISLAGTASADPASEPGQVPTSRSFRFTYAATVTGLKPGEEARIWLPVPLSDEHQKVRLISRNLPAKAQVEKGTEYGNHFLYMEARANAQGEIPLQVVYAVTRDEVRTDFQARSTPSGSLARFLQADRLVPVGGPTLNLIKGKTLPEDQLAAAREIYNIVDQHMKYKKVGKGWGRGDAVWACDNGYGNCTDFHSLFISLARARKIPAKFTIGFPLPTDKHAGKVPGYHCWAWFHPEGHGWIPVDISEANKNPKMRSYYFGNLTPDRIAFTTGRDIELTPKQDGPPLNYFIYPYVEVLGKPYSEQNIKNQCSFEDTDK